MGKCTSHASEKTGQKLVQTPRQCTLCLLAGDKDLTKEFQKYGNIPIINKLEGCQGTTCKACVTLNKCFKWHINRLMMENNCANLH